MNIDWIYRRVTDYYRNPFLRLRIAILLGLLIAVFGTLGFELIAHDNLLDSFYMMVITLSSVGYGVDKPLGPTGKLFVISLILVGVGTGAWVFSTIVGVVASEQAQHMMARKRMDRMIAHLTKHYIICGYGRIGQQIATGYTQNRVPFVVLEQDPGRIAMLREQGFMFVEGDASDDESLKFAGIERAAALIAVTPTDAVNTFIVLSARGIRRDLYIVARADSSQNEAKLYKAGASKVVSPHILGGRWMGITAINPAVTDFVTAITDTDSSKFQLREFRIQREESVAGQTFGQARLRERTGALVVAMRTVGNPDHFVPNPADDTVLKAGDVLIVIGSPEQLSLLGGILSPIKT
jgi:voltage-gated potassium channel